MVKPIVYACEDFPSFFSAHLKWLKSTNPKYSLRWVARQLGLKSHSYLLALCAGTKSPTKSMLNRMAEIFDLNVDDFAYIKVLVGLQTAKTLNEKEFFVQHLAEIKKRAPEALLELEVFEMMSHWYYLAIFELVGLPSFQSDPIWIAEQLGDALGTTTIQDALDRLIRLKFLEKGPSGHYRRCIETFTTTNNIPSAAIRNFHRQMLQLAERTLDHVPVPQRLFFGQTMGISKENLDEAQNLIVAFRARFDSLMKTSQPDSVYQLAIQFFPLTKS